MSAFLDLPDGRRITLHCRAGRKGARPLIILHGMERDAPRYLAQWVAADEDCAFDLIAPEFDQAQFPGWRGYNLGGQGAVFSALSQISADAGGADCYGHSAGAQVVQRYVLFGGSHDPAARFIAANAGWYTAPEEAPYPYGLTGGPNADLPAAFARNLILLSGEADTDNAHHTLRHDTGADRQGADRFARARWMMQCANNKATEIGARLTWRHETATDAGHSNRAMIPMALNLLKAPRRH